MKYRPSETTLGAVWVNNFPPEDRRAAELLLNSLRVLSDATFRAALTDRLSGLVRHLQPPIAIYPIRELPKGDSDTEGPGDHAEEVAPSDPAKRRIFLPLDHPHSALPGSEAHVGNIIRDVIGSRNRADETIASSPQEIEDLRRIKVRTIVLVDDYSGTGNRVGSYLRAWAQDPTIRSWFSYKLVKFHVVLHAVSLAALRALERNPWVEQVHFSEHAAGFSTVRWSKGEAAEIRELCEKHGFKKSHALGYKRSEGLWVMQHTVPNNLPMILWQDRHKSISDWQPFFGDRKMSPALQQELGDYRLETRAEDIAASLRQPRLSRALSDQPGATTRLILLVLAASARGVRDVRRLSLLLGTPLASAEAAQQACAQLGLLDPGARLTPEGHRELAAARRRAPLAVKPHRLIGRDTPYYPWQLRGVSDI
ncbi:hypothetical protein [Streptomyces sp. CRN 30]|uniref:phosphoribosyltransferase-like protein n=1 Tax=Streptomyces sp. CRN 30 TaxID=3075613 RepID=UPI002A7F191E|nr:hypothetical protein [Streptomyces sp. CRN 30]